MQQEQKQKRKFSRVKKEKRVKREPYIAGKSPCCPRCGEAVAIQLEKTSTAGVRRYRCFSEECKKNSVRPGRGRGFTVPVGRPNCKRI